MRFIFLFVALVSPFCLTAGQSSDDNAMAVVLQNEASDGYVNLDPTLSETTGIVSKAGEDEPQVENCTTEDGFPGLCVKYYLCDQDSKTIIEDGYTIIDVRIGGACAKLLDVCCRRNQINEEPKKVTTTTTVPPIAASTDDKAISPTDLNIPLVFDKKTKTGKCGISNPGINIFGDTPRMSDDDTPLSPDNKVYADFGEYPWMVAVLRRHVEGEKWNKNNYKGGGTLIHPSVVMTVAHNVAGMQPEELKIRAGDWDTNTQDEEYEHQEVNVAKIVVHQNYFRPSLYNDIALLFLERPVVMDSQYPNIALGCLDRRPPPVNATCFSMGWGANNFNNKNVYASVLKKVKLGILDHNDCESKLKKTRLGPLFRLHSSFICAGGEQGVDTCKGDGGSSLVCRIKNSYAVYGMVSWGLSCGNKEVPGVYVNVPSFYDWVTSQVAAEGHDTKTYVIT
ncbi:phenoloxidase-activating factor 2 isoform X1 [Papilio machaon]|uniref:phenoloxidase-activating factor 2 isoform X1 n=1 Tax=Papilio machaon TaxID=76193 RepID=UPI001E66497B|nr:phenoloxidase-activating factor 2 isoform X1 [Papilio machaon]